MDDFSSFEANLISPARGGQQVTPSDSVDLTKLTKAVYVGQSGDLSVIMEDGSPLTFEAVAAGTLLPIRVSRVMSTGTSANGIIGVW